MRAPLPLIDQKSLLSMCLNVAALLPFTVTVSHLRRNLSQAIFSSTLQGEGESYELLSLSFKDNFFCEGSPHLSWIVLIPFWDISSFSYSFPFPYSMTLLYTQSSPYLSHFLPHKNLSHSGCSSPISFQPFFSLCFCPWSTTDTPVLYIRDHPCPPHWISVTLIS